MGWRNYRKKPVVIAAIQWTGTNGNEVGTFLEDGGADWWVEDDDWMVIPTLEGDMRADPGDWVIRGVKGEFYPCKPDVFQATYDAVEAVKA